MFQVDCIINCRWLIPVEPEGVVYENYALIIDKGKIKDLLAQQDVANYYQATEVLWLNRHALLPGFVNAHTHSPMTLFRGLADDLPLMEWLTKHIWPAEAKWMSDEFIQDGTRLAIAEMIKSGTTCFNEHFFYPGVTIQEAQQAKIRACVGGHIINFPTSWAIDENDGFNKFLTLYHEYPAEGLLTWSLAPHAPYTITDAILRKIADFSAIHQLPIHIHLHETAQEITESLQQYGKRPLKRLYDLGLLSKRLQCVHMTQVNDEDLILLQETNTQVTHCPESNLKLASGYCKVHWLMEAGINVALGTDGAASNNDLDMLAEMRIAALAGKTIANDATAVSAMQALRMATLNGAKALGLDDIIGSIKIGKSADIIAIDLVHLNTIPVYHPLSQIVYAATHQQITDVFVAGQPLLRKGELQTIDEEDVFARAAKWEKRIKNA